MEVNPPTHATRRIQKSPIPSLAPYPTPPQDITITHSPPLLPRFFSLSQYNTLLFSLPPESEKQMYTSLPPSLPIPIANHHHHHPRRSLSCSANKNGRKHIQHHIHVTSNQEANHAAKIRAAKTPFDLVETDGDSITCNNRSYPARVVV